MRTILLAIAITCGCQRDHDLTVLLGPNPTTPSQGFLCKQDADPSKFLLQDPAVFDGAMVHINVVVDIVSFGGRLPGCRGEEIVQACRSGTCKLVASPTTERYCVPVAFPVSLAGDQTQLMAAVTQQLEVRPIVENAPNEPVIVRAVATSQPCAAIATPANGAYPALDGSLAVGCAYSCPAVLDEIAGPISLSIDALDDRCEQTVRVCAAFPVLR